MGNFSVMGTKLEQTALTPFASGGCIQYIYFQANQDQGNMQ